MLLPMNHLISVDFWLAVPAAGRVPLRRSGMARGVPTKTAPQRHFVSVPLEAHSSDHGGGGDVA